MQSITFEANDKFLTELMALAKQKADEQQELLIIYKDCFEERYERDLEALERGELELRPLSELKEKIKSW